MAEQVIAVPKISCLSQPGRTVLGEPQMVGQLVEVSTVLTISFLQQQTAEQDVGLQFPVLVEIFSVFSQSRVPHCELWSRTLTFQFLAHVLVEVCTVVPPVRAPHSVMWSRTSTFQFLAHVLVEVCTVFPPGHVSQHTVEQIVDIPVCRMRDGAGFPVFPLDRVLLRLVEQVIMFGGVIPQDIVQRRSVDLNTTMMTVFSQDRVQ